MKECCETGEPKKKRYWHWVALGCVVVLALALQMIPVRIGPFSQRANVTSRANLVAILHALDEYANNNRGTYPSSLQPLVMPDTNGYAYLEGYNGKFPKDPWKHEYQYEPPTPEHSKPRVWSYGADGKRGGTGDNADIDSDHLVDETR